MRTDTLQLASELAGRREAFALATVVRREPPSSARVGDSAVVTRDGEFHGWLGGSCTRPTVVREALAALADGAPRLIGIVRDPDSSLQARSGLTVFPMACHSGGSVEIYIEPLLPARRLLIFGVSPTAQALARLAAVLGYRVEAVDPEAGEALFPDASRLVTSDGSIEPPGSGQDAARCCAVVATLGQRDEEAAWAASRLEPGYLGVVASRKRFGQVRETLAARGATPEQARPDRQSGRPRHRGRDPRGDCPEHSRRDHQARARSFPGPRCGSQRGRNGLRAASRSRHRRHGYRARPCSRRRRHGHRARPGSRRGRHGYRARPCSRRGRHGHRARSGVRDDRCRGGRQSPGRCRGKDLVLLLRALPRPVRRGAAQVRRGRGAGGVA